MKLFKSPFPEITLKYKKGDLKKRKISSSKTAADTFREVFDSDLIEYQESFMAIFLNNANNTVGWFKISVGGMTATLVDVRILMIAALKVGAVGMIVSHNHPSGTLKPSQADIRLTKKIKSGGEFLDIKLLDHIIITSESYYSFSDENML